MDIQIVMKTLTTKNATSACVAPLIMFGTKSLCPGASRMVNVFDFVEINL